MVKIEKNYLVIENNVVKNIIVWDGVEKISELDNLILLVLESTKCLIWEPILQNGKITDYELVEKIGCGSIGFTWDGYSLATNYEKPIIPTYKD